MNTLWLLTADETSLREVGGALLLMRKLSGAAQAGAEGVVIASHTGIGAPGCRVVQHPSALRTPAEITRHVLGALWQSGHEQPTHVMLMDPSVPLTRRLDYEQALAFARRGYDAVLAMRPVEQPTAFTARIDGDGSVNALAARLAGYGDERQTFDAEWELSASLALFRTDMFLRTGSIYGGARNRGLLVGRWSALEVTDDVSAALAEWALERGLV